jgi:hypothetical protein
MLAGIDIHFDSWNGLFARYFGTFRMPLLDFFLGGFAYFDDFPLKMQVKAYQGMVEVQ